MSNGNEFYINYENKKVRVTKNPSRTYKYMICLPSEEKDGETMLSCILGNEKQWKYNTYPSSKITECESVVLEEVGKVSHIKTDGTKEVIDYNYGDEVSDSVREKAKMIYDFGRIIYTREKLFAARRNLLESYLKFAGFNSILDVIKGNLGTSEIFDIRKLGELMESYDTSTSRQDEMSIADMESENEKVDKKKAEISEVLTVKDDLNERVRHLLPDFGMDIYRQVEKKDMTTYSSVATKMAKLLISFNYDLLTEEELKEIRTRANGEEGTLAYRAFGITDKTGMEFLDAQDEVASIIDSKSYAQACRIEDRFVAGEADRFNECLAGMEIDDPEVKENTVALILENLRREVISTRDERTTLKDKYSIMADEFARGMKISYRGKRKEEGEGPDYE